MYYKVLLLLLVSFCVYADDLTLLHMDNLYPFQKPTDRSGRYIDVYTNHDDFKEVVDSYYGVPRRPNHRRFERLPEILHDISVEKLSPQQLENSARLDRIDFHYPSSGSEELESNFGSSSEEEPSQTNKYVFIQSQKVIPNEGVVKHKRPIFKTSKYTPISNVQKIPKPTTAPVITKNKYEELNINNNTGTTRSTKGRINQLLRKYLTQLYEKKYNDSVSNIYPTTLSRLDQEQKTKKLLNVNSLKNKINKFFSLFTIVQFNNTQCTASSSSGDYQGVCYIASQCTTEGGTAIGNCANGYGVCCVFVDTCGGSGSRNCTYFQSPNYPDYYPSDGDVVVPTTTSPTNPSPTPDPRFPWYYNINNLDRQDVDDVYSCTFSVSKLNDNISKIRIDFEDLELTGPTNGTCSDERLVISGQNTNDQLPEICGYNTGQHVYVDVSSLSGPLQISILSSSGARKRFKLKICQFENTCLEPSSNCLQYYTGVTGIVSSFNYDQASMLSRSVPGYFNNLNYAICIRREEGYCSITYKNVVNGVEYPFQLTNVDDSGNMIISAGQAGADIINCPDDYIVIDGTRLCGDKFNDGSVNDDFTMNADVTDTGAGPIVIPVRTDSSTTGIGFKLFYTQNRCSGYKNLDYKYY